MHSLTLTLTLLVQFVIRMTHLPLSLCEGHLFFLKTQRRKTDGRMWSTGLLVPHSLLPSVPQFKLKACLQNSTLINRLFFPIFLLACFPVVFISLLKIRLYINMLPSMFQSAVNNINPQNLTNMQCRRRLTLASESQCRDFLLENKSDELKGNNNKKKIW